MGRRCYIFRHCTGSRAILNPALTYHTTDSIHSVSVDAWNALAGCDYPFTRHEFLAALEDSDSVGINSGWLPQHLLVYDDTTLIAVMPRYEKSHSYGEYVFDWSWADAYHRAGREYYPKLLCAIPFTPATGPRLCHNNTLNHEQLADIAQHLCDDARTQGYSSWHLLLAEQNTFTEQLKNHALHRIGVQYHWLNEGYDSFDDFLAAFSSRKRKDLRKERLKVLDQGVSLHTFTGAEIDDDIWQAFYLFYQLTYAKRSGHGGYLTEEFFRLIGATLKDHVVLVMARLNGEWVAGALNFKSDNCLYGRYWGTRVDIDGLHFETCYYQGIEYCIANGLNRFDPGAQGEHKIKRGFTPVAIDSWHWLADQDFEQAIANFLEDEHQHIQQYIVQASQQLPFKRG